ncbi:MAG: DUF1614 domain-containing protein [Hydrogenibacillus sp.]|nr:DUF1614 domain-containing protein [Hydrogenibacillus sp.]
MPFVWLFLLLLLVPFLLGTLFFQITTFSFTKLGLSPIGATALLSLSVLGSMVNIPITRRRTVVYRERRVHPFFPMFYYYPPQVQEQVIAVNVGGAIIPVLFSLYLLVTAKAPLGPTLVAALIIVAVSKALARPVRGVGIAIPAFIPPLVAALVALVLARDDAAPVAYVSGVLGTLIGADLLNLHRLREIGGQALSIGGAGVFDGIFLISIIAAFLA